MRGQEYDNRANMKGEHEGMQAKIRNINPRAFLYRVVATPLPWWNLRLDNNFNAILVDAGKMASEMDADKNFGSIP
ncbi:hypothetical protein AVEN_62004-1 [Araneus ventricosus]|uniref:Uncharacterized protein n=1 Tax=Araneus ventricosus TaxID=182803 RepID=A0A4Y2EDA7_ARAVE|nr:hypothetical protein AVEN_62004-1 [Araneus ventricosus]